MAYDYQPRSTLRADAFVAFVRQQRVADPSGAKVRVMTIHSAKGLQFDVVVLPELDTSLTGKAPTFVAGRDAASLDINFVCRYADDKVQKLLPQDQLDAFEKERQATSRGIAVPALCRHDAGSERLAHVHSWQAKTRTQGRLVHIAPGHMTNQAPKGESAICSKHGDPNWLQHRLARPALPDIDKPEKPPSITV